MASGEFDHVVGGGFARFVAACLEPFVLQDGHLKGEGTLDDGIHFRNIRPPIRLNLTYGYHGAVPYATVELLEAKFKIGRTDKYRTIGAVGKSHYGPQH